MAFIESPRFPECISRQSVFVPMYNTTTIVLGSGQEKRNANWSTPRLRVNIATGIKSQDDLETVLDLFYAAKGSANGFRIKNFLDFTSNHTSDAVDPNDQVLGTGTGSLTTFQLIKTYTAGVASSSRNITKPVSGTVRVSLNGTEQLSGFTVDTATGIVTFSGAPGNGVIVRAGFQYDMPVRFENDEISIVLSQYLYGEASCNLIEIKGTA